jgi:hypothetical protein
MSIVMALFRDWETKRGPWSTGLDLLATTFPQVNCTSITMWHASSLPP